VPALENPKHERFAQALAKGKTASEAYVLAGYKESRAAASRLSTKINIVDRVAQLQDLGAQRAEVTIASLIQEAADIQEAAKVDKQYAAATSALTAKAKLAGLWIDKNENTNRNVDPTQVSDADLAAVVAADGGQGTTAPPVNPSKLN
jgi:phage terminase small subunit